LAKKVDQRKRKKIRKRKARWKLITSGRGPRSCLARKKSVVLGGKILKRRDCKGRFFFRSGTSIPDWQTVSDVKGGTTRRRKKKNGEKGMKGEKRKVEKPNQTT